LCPIKALLNAQGLGPACGVQEVKLRFVRRREVSGLDMISPLLVLVAWGFHSPAHSSRRTTATAAAAAFLLVAASGALEDGLGDKTTLDLQSRG
jgi:hypothetical protein